MRATVSSTLALLTAMAVSPAMPVAAAESCSDLDAKCFVDLKTGIRMAYVELGPKDGKAVILLHGLTDSARSWASTMAALHEKDASLHIIAVDQRGHGKTSMPGGANCPAEPKTCFKPALFADDVVAFMDEQGIGKATIAGHSMGSMVAQDLALDHPERVDSLVLVATSNKTAGNAILQDYVLKEPVLGSWKTGLDSKGMTSAEQVWTATPLDADPAAEAWIAKNWDVDPAADPTTVAAIVKETAQVRIGTWRGATEALLEVDNTARLAGLTVPTLVLWGSQDSIFYLDPDQTGIIAALEKAKAAHRTVGVWKQYGVDPLPASGAQDSDIGHNVQWDAPLQVADDILSFIKTATPTSDRYRAVIGNNGSAIQKLP